jgi:hypothetical protein
MGMMGLKLIVAAYFALVAVLCAAGIFVLSVHGMQCGLRRSITRIS